MLVSILTLFPEAVAPYLNSSILGRAQANGLLQVHLVNPRSFTLDKHNKVDDSPYGGGAGMVLACQPVEAAFQALQPLKPSRRVLLTAPHGRRFNQAMAEELATVEQLVIFCGHYEGFDERLATLIPELEAVSLGDFVLTGGELAALCLVDATVRHLPGVVKEADSVANDSFTTGLLDYPHYTRPAQYKGLAVPEVLLSGNHGRVAQWRRLQSLWRTWQLRPDLLDNAAILNGQDQTWLGQFRDGLTAEQIWEAL